MPNNYEQEVCNILKETTIHQRLDELKERTKVTGHEHAFNVCSDGRVTEVIEGNEVQVNNAKIIEECNDKIDINIHSHPYSPHYPSPGDFMVDLYNQIRIASCVYSTKDDKVACYRTSDEFRNKYIPSLKESFNKIKEIHNKYDNTTDPEEKLRLSEAYRTERNRVNYLINRIEHIIIKDLYPDITHKRDYPFKIRETLKFGNFGDVWIKDCGKI